MMSCHTWLRLIRCPQHEQYSEGGSKNRRLSPHALHMFSSAWSMGTIPGCPANNCSFNSQQQFDRNLKILEEISGGNPEGLWSLEHMCWVHRETSWPQHNVLLKQSTCRRAHANANMLQQSNATGLQRLERAGNFCHRTVQV